jgi:hypothetical protein
LHWQRAGPLLTILMRLRAQFNLGWLYAQWVEGQVKPKQATSGHRTCHKHPLKFLKCDSSAALPPDVRKRLCPSENDAFFIFGATPRRFDGAQP